MKPNPIDMKYGNPNADLELVMPGPTDFKVIDAYLKNNNVVCFCTLIVLAFFFSSAVHYSRQCCNKCVKPLLCDICTTKTQRLEVTDLTGK